MTNPVEGTQGPQPPPEAAQGPQGANKAAETTAATTVSSVGELANKAPELYKAMMEGIAMRIIGDQRKHNRRMKELHRKGREQNR